MRTGIRAHRAFLGEQNISLLDGLDFVFLCIDRGTIKRQVADYLTTKEISFIDVGMGVTLTNGRLGGIVRVTTSTPVTRDAAAAHLSYSEDAEGNEYASNIQIAELNALNATLAVIRWKALQGIYHDRRKSYYLGYSIGSGELVHEP
jgi:hypothetical protein